MWEEMKEMWGSMGRSWKMWEVCWNVGEVWRSRGRCVWGVGKGVGNVLGKEKFANFVQSKAFEPL